MRTPVFALEIISDRETKMAIGVINTMEDLRRSCQNCVL